jgi:hypothetical protein
MNNYGYIIYIMKSDEICKYLGWSVLVLILLYVCIRSLRFQANIIEGLTSKNDSSSDSSGTTTDKDNIADAVKSNTATIADPLLVTKYRSSYEDSIIAMEANVSAALLSEMMNNSDTVSKDPTSIDAQKSIVIMNNLSTYRETLNRAMNILDSS